MWSLLLLMTIAMVKWPVAGDGDFPVPGCATRCWENTKYISKCTNDNDCLCREPEYQDSVFKCLYSQCDTAHFGSALHHTISQCSGVADNILFAVPPIPNHDSLRRREAEYLAGAKLYGSGSDAGYPTQSAYPMQSGAPYIPASGIFVSSIPPLYFPRDTATATSKESADATQTAYNAADLITSGPLLFTSIAPNLRPCIFFPILALIPGLYLAI